MFKITESQRINVVTIIFLVLYLLGYCVVPTYENKNTVEIESVFRQAKPAVPGYRSAALVSQNAKRCQGWPRFVG
jgi:hypothetical protein